MPQYFSILAGSYPCGLLPCDRRKLLREFYSAISDPASEFILIVQK
jgi:hypothetical protein